MRSQQDGLLLLVSVAWGTDGGADVVDGTSGIWADDKIQRGRGSTRENTNEVCDVVVGLKWFVAHFEGYVGSVDGNGVVIANSGTGFCCC